MQILRKSLCRPSLSLVIIDISLQSGQGQTPHDSEALKKTEEASRKNRIGTDRWGCSLWAENVHSDVHGNTNNKMYPLAYFFSLISLVKLQVYLKCTQMYFFVSLTLVLTQTCSFLRVGNKVKAVTYSVCSSLLK